MRQDIQNKRKQIEEWIGLHRTKAFICRELKCRPETLDTHLKRMGITYDGNQAGKGQTKQGLYVSALEYSQTNHCSSHKLKLKLIREGVKSHQCEQCNRKKWQGHPIPIELDHIDGDHYNNDLTNLRILCSNCHSLTLTHAGKNIGRYDS